MKEKMFESIKIDFNTIKNFKKYKWGDLCSLEYGKSIRVYQDKEDKYPVWKFGVIGFQGTLSNEPGVIVSEKELASIILKTFCLLIQLLVNLKKHLNWFTLGFLFNSKFSLKT